MAKKKKRNRLNIKDLPIYISISDEPVSEEEVQRCDAVLERCWEVVAELLLSEEAKKAEPPEPIPKMKERRQIPPSWIGRGIV